MYTPLNLSGIPLQFDTAVREGDLDSLRLCMACLMACSNEVKIQILHNDEKYGYLGLCLARFSADRHGGTHSSMSKERRDARLSMAELLLEFGCSCNPKFVNIDQIERHVVTALLRFPTEFESIDIIEKNREIALCQRLIDGGALLDFFREFSEHRALLHLLMSHHWLGMLRDIKEFHILGAEITAENLLAVFDPTPNPNNFCFDFPMLGRMVMLDYLPGHPNALTVLALCNNCPVPVGAYHSLKWDRDGVLVNLFEQQGWNPSVPYNEKTVLHTWVDTMVATPYYLDAAYNNIQLQAFATHHAECFCETVDGTVLSDVIVARVNSFNGVTPRDIIMQGIFEEAQKRGQHLILEQAVAAHTTHAREQRKI